MGLRAEAKERPMPASMRAEQERHDAHHPGKICQRCPSNEWATIEAYRRNAVWAAMAARRDRMAAALALVVLFGCWLLAGLVH